MRGGMEILKLTIALLAMFAFYKAGYYKGKNEVINLNRRQIGN